MTTTDEPIDRVHWGVSIPLAGLPLHEHRPVVEALPTLGFTDVWTAEGVGFDAFTPLAACSAWAPSLRVGTGVVPVFTRGPAVLAQTATALADLSPSGRVLLGIGASVPDHVTVPNGIAYDRPLARMRDTARFLRRALHGEPIGSDFTTFSVGEVRLPVPPRVPPKVIVGALRPKMLELAFAEADGAITNLLTSGDVPKVVSAIRPPEVGQELIVKIFICPTTDAAHARAAGRRFLGWILNQDVYRNFHGWLGRGELLAESHERFRRGDLAGAAASLPEPLVDELWIHGTLAQCRERIARYLHPAVTTVVLYLASVPDLQNGTLSLGQVLEELSPPRIRATAQGIAAGDSPLGSPPRTADPGR